MHVQEVQNDLAESIDVIYSNFDSRPKHVVMLLTAIYNDNVDLCYQVSAVCMCMYVYGAVCMHMVL